MYFWAFVSNKDRTRLKVVPVELGFPPFPLPPSSIQEPFSFQKLRTRGHLTDVNEHPWWLSNNQQVLILEENGDKRHVVLRCHPPLD